MKKFFRVMSSFLVAAGMLAAGPAIQAATIKCWTNKEGVKECGTRVPPEFSQEGHEEINKQGRVIKEEERAKTQEELDADKATDAAELEQKKAIEERAKKDKILLDVYTKVEDIEKVRDDNIKNIKGRITLAKSRVDKIQADLDKRIQAAAEAERGGKTPNAVLLKDIEVLKQRVKDNQNFIAEQQKQVEDTRAAYSADIERFKELKQKK